MVSFDEILYKQFFHEHQWDCPEWHRPEDCDADISMKMKGMASLLVKSFRSDLTTEEFDLGKLAGK